MDSEAKREIQGIISLYNSHVKGVVSAANSANDRAFGGVIRADKGKLVEMIAERLVYIAWQYILKQDMSRLKMNKKKMPIGINDDYIRRIRNPNIKAYVEENRSRLIYKFGTDVQVFIDGKLVLPIECKAYAENAMLKRILFDAELMNEAAGIDTYYLLQLESQLGGDFSELNDLSFGSPATHALLSHCNVNLQIITLLYGERKVDKPIHNPQNFKELESRALENAVSLFSEALRPYAR